MRTSSAATFTIGELAKEPGPQPEAVAGDHIVHCKLQIILLADRI